MSLILLRDECDPGVRCLSAPWGGALDRQCFKCRFPFSYIFPIIVHYTNHSLQVNGYNLGRKREKIVAALTRNETIGRRRQNDVSSCQTRCGGASPLSSSSSCPAVGVRAEIEAAGGQDSFSLRTWQCRAAAEQLPCSGVGAGQPKPGRSGADPNRGLELGDGALSSWQLSVRMLRKRERCLRI